MFNNGDLIIATTSNIEGINNGDIYIYDNGNLYLTNYYNSNVPFIVNFRAQYVSDAYIKALGNTPLESTSEIGFGGLMTTDLINETNFKVLINLSFLLVNIRRLLTAQQYTKVELLLSSLNVKLNNSFNRGAHNANFSLGDYVINYLFSKGSINSTRVGEHIPLSTYYLSGRLKSQTVVQYIKLLDASGYIPANPTEDYHLTYVDDCEGKERYCYYKFNNRDLIVNSFKAVGEMEIWYSRIHIRKQIDNQFHQNHVILERRGCYLIKNEDSDEFKRTQRFAYAADIVGLNIRINNLLSSPVPDSVEVNTETPEPSVQVEAEVPTCRITADITNNRRTPKFKAKPTEERLDYSKLKTGDLVKVKVKGDGYYLHEYVSEGIIITDLSKTTLTEDSEVTVLIKNENNVLEELDMSVINIKKGDEYTLEKMATSCFIENCEKSGELFGLYRAKHKLIGKELPIVSVENGFKCKLDGQNRDTVVVQYDNRQYRFLKSDVKLVLPKYNVVQPKKDRTIRSESYCKIIDDRGLDIPKGTKVKVIEVKRTPVSENSRRLYKNSKQKQLDVVKFVDCNTGKEYTSYLKKLKVI